MEGGVAGGDSGGAGIEVPAVSEKSRCWIDGRRNFSSMVKRKSTDYAGKGQSCLRVTEG